MRVLRKTILFAVIASTFACHDTSAPVQPANYVLVSIDGRSLPTYSSPTPAFTVLSGTFLLDGSHATANEIRRDSSGNEYTFNVRYRYTIAGNVIRFDYDPPCGGPAVDCARVPKGTIFGSHLLIDYSGGNNDPVYDYLRGGEI